ncbi:MAG: alpha/beta hydrolase [Deltaproteobacteria bacterium]|nr:alpha/beta hydrolase [Deltaproteobacteria bacterium]
MANQEWREETVRVAGTDLVYITGGTGAPVLVLHEELGHPGWLRWHSELARTRTVIIPHHPGFGKTPRVESVRNVRDLGNFYTKALRERSLRPVEVIGFSLGGWIAADMAASDPSQFQKMVLVAPTGVKPPQGDIMDLFILTAKAYLDASVQDIQSAPEFAKLYGGEPTPEQFEAWEDARAESARLAWVPYMFYPNFASLLENVVGLPTLLVWGKQDQIVPFSAAEVYKKSISGAELVAFDNCGHRPEVEKQAEFSQHLQRFLA